MGRLGSHFGNEAPGQVDGEPRARAHAAGHVDLAADGLHQVLDDRQPKPGPAQLAAPRLVDAVESLEDPRQVGPGDSDAGVGDLDAWPNCGRCGRVTETVPPSGVYLMALSIRLSTIWRMASSSARTMVSSSSPPGSNDEVQVLGLGPVAVRLDARFQDGHEVKRVRVRRSPGPTRSGPGSGGRESTG